MGSCNAVCWDCAEREPHNELTKKCDIRGENHSGIGLLHFFEIYDWNDGAGSKGTLRY